MIDKFKKFIDKISYNNYLIAYSVTNYNSDEKNYNIHSRTYNGWESSEYSYIISALSNLDAIENFKIIWGKKASSLSPTPRLNILSIRKIDKTIDKKVISNQNLNFS